MIKIKAIKVKSGDDVSIVPCVPIHNWSNVVSVADWYLIDDGLEVETIFENNETGFEEVE